jgi:hypothetical protein
MTICVKKFTHEFPLPEHFAKTHAGNVTGFCLSRSFATLRISPGGSDAAKTAQNVNGFWVMVCQVVPIRAEESAENPIDCRIFFADNSR